MNPASPNPPNPVPPNPIYYFVKDLLGAKEYECKSLREITHQRWQGLNEEETSTLEKFIQPSVEPFNSELALVESFFGKSPTERIFTIASTNVFVHTPRLCIPAEIGITRFCLKHGIVAKFHSLIEPDPIPVTQVANVLNLTEQYHQIPHYGRIWPFTKTLLRNLYCFVNPNRAALHDGTALVFVEDDELEQCQAVFSWCAAKSAELDVTDYDDWKVHCIPLSTVWTYLKNYTEMALTEDDRFAFKTSIFDYSWLCSHHTSLDCPHCAMSKSHVYAYVLADTFCPRLGINMEEERHKPMPYELP